MLVALDTNVWSWIGDARQAEALAELEQDGDVEIVLHPSVLSELARNPKLEAVLSTLEAMILVPRQTVLPEAASEGFDLVSLIRIHEPGWARRMPRHDRLAKLRKWWLRDAWRMAKHDPGWLIGSLRGTNDVTGHEEVVAQLVEEQRRTQAQVRDINVRVDHTAMVYHLDNDAPPSVHPGWLRGDAIDFWRVRTMQVYWHSLVIIPRRAALVRRHIDQTDADWVGASVHLGRLGQSQAAFERLILYTATPQELPRSWLRYAVELEQLNTKVGAGNPWDTSHASYVFDCDLMVTGDRRFAQIMQRVLQNCPGPHGRVELLRNSHDPVLGLSRLLKPA